MRQFDVYPNPSGATRAYAPYVVVLQSHHVELETIVIAPLVADAKLLDPIDFAVEFDGEPLILAMSELSAISTNRLKRRIGSVSDREDDIRRALDRLFTGF